MNEELTPTGLEIDGYPVHLNRRAWFEARVGDYLLEAHSFVALRQIIARETKRFDALAVPVNLCDVGRHHRLDLELVRIRFTKKGMPEIVDEMPLGGRFLVKPEPGLAERLAAIRQRYEDAEREWREATQNLRTITPEDVGL